VVYCENIKEHPKKILPPHLRFLIFPFLVKAKAGVLFRSVKTLLNYYDRYDKR